MTKTVKFFISILLASLTMACDAPTNTQRKSSSFSDSTTTTKEVSNDYSAIKFVDSFMMANNDAIQKNTALREHNEALCTKHMLPLIDKKGLYDDMPFKLVTTTTHNGTAYGNFIYDDDRHFVKVTCIINEKQLQNLKENNQYQIKFKTEKFQGGVSFANEFSKIELPTVNAYLTSYTPHVK